MSLYYEASAFLQPDNRQTLAARIYGTKGLKCKASNIYALASQTIKWSQVLSGIIEKSEILGQEKKLSPALALVLSHDLLVSHTGVAAPKGHVLRLVIERHKARLTAEFTRARIKANHSSVESWQAALDCPGSTTVPSNTPTEGLVYPHPRWVRVNTLLSAFETELSSVFPTYSSTDSLCEVINARASDHLITQDSHLPHLLALPPSTNITKTQAYLKGHIILQDKASCFPAYLLDPQPDDGDIIDACAAPGNKTTHLAALLVASRKVRGGVLHPQKIYACERDRARSQTLLKMVTVAGAAADDLVTCLSNQDFKRLKPGNPEYRNVGALLLDPSCSGSGIVGRDDTNADALPQAVFPRTQAQISQEMTLRSTAKKRKRVEPMPSSTEVVTAEEQPNLAASVDTGEPEYKKLPERLKALSAFQLSLLKHAFAFPAARKVVYSTCSIYPEENEHVVVKALSSDIARQRGWRICTREEQVDGMRRWAIRGDAQAVRWFMASDHEDVNKDFAKGMTEQGMECIAQACLRCEKGTDEGTMGFFAVKFVRRLAVTTDGHDDEDWAGFSDND